MSVEIEKSQDNLVVLTEESPLAVFSFNSYFEKIENHFSIKYSFFTFLQTEDILRIRILNKISYNVVLQYLKELLLEIHVIQSNIMLDIFFWVKLMTFFFKDSVNLQSVDRKQDKNIELVLSRHRNNFFLVDSNQVVSQCMISFDSLPAEYIQICDHANPERHTCSATKRINVPLYITNEVISQSEFLKEFKKRVTCKSSDEVFQLHGRCHADIICEKDNYFVILLFESFLKGLNEIMERRTGSIKFYKTEYLAYGAIFLYHRLWYQIEVSWSEKSLVLPAVLRRQEKERNKSSSLDKNRLKKKYSSQVISSTKVEEKVSNSRFLKKSDKDDNVKDDMITKLFFSLMDHFTWEF